ncbi:MAG: class I SAM-dependent methyltransferase [Desulfobacterales bacterium]|jgi:2-polyprenyl-3-methyl-5-hydroxy-6-metoxy-1,4-benzoquinol methylase|nr:class I SAM-dependent methyltransferase [Desulfobacterales bacterium]
MNSARAAWTIYGKEPAATRLHVLVRTLTCPFEPLLKRFPAQGAALDVGCGHGLLINLLARDPLHAGLTLCGIDHDAAKIEQARRSAPAGVEFSTRRLEAFPAHCFDAVSVVDVLYTVRREAWGEILAGCLRVLRPGGRLILKEVIDRPRWKYWTIMAQETLSVTLFGITKGERPHFESAADYCRAVAQAGFGLLEAQPLKSATWISHFLVVAQKPAGLLP